MRLQLHAGLGAAVLVAALATTAVAQPAPSKTSPGRGAATVTDVGPPPAEDRDSVGAIVMGAPPARLADTQRATQTLGAPPAPQVEIAPSPTRGSADSEALRKRGAGSLTEE